MAIAIALAAAAGAARKSMQHPGSSPISANAAKAEGALTVYGSMNEQEALPLWKLFEDATGVKVSYVRSSDTQIMARVAIENRAGQHTWDIAFTTTVAAIAASADLAPFDPPEAERPDGRGARSQSPLVRRLRQLQCAGLQHQFRQKADLPKSYDEFAAHKEWAGKIAIDDTDDEWLAAICAFYGDARGRALVKTIVAALDPVITDGHLALARSVGSGEYWLALNNFLPLTLNVKMSGAPTDFWLIDPVPLIFGSVGVNTLAPHPECGETCRQLRAKPGRRDLHDAQGPHADTAGRGDQSARSRRDAQGEKDHADRVQRRRSDGNGKRPTTSCSERH